jgi:hypothetical protein
MAPGIATPPGYTLLSSVQFLNTLTAACDVGIAEIAIATQTIKARSFFIASIYFQKLPCLKVATGYQGG